MKARCILAAGLLAVASGASAGQEPTRIPAARELALEGRLSPEQPTLFLFYRPASESERALAAELRREYAARVGLRWIELATGQEPLARQNEVRETPTGIVYDRRARLVGRASDPAAIREHIRRALAVMRIDWAEDADPRMAEVERILGRRPPGGIMRTMSLRPELLASINEAARKAHFADGFLDRRTKELIATHVSALNHCKF